MKTFFAAFLGTLAALAVAVILPATILLRKVEPRVRVSTGATLIQPIGGVLEDAPASRFRTPFSPAGGRTQTEILGNLKRAAADPRITRVFLDLDPVEAGFAKCEELRAAIHGVRNAGKPVIAWASQMTPKTYAVAAACDSILMPPLAPFVFPGFSMTREYYKGALDRIGVGVNLSRIESYKSSPEAFIRTDMSPEARAMSTRLLTDQVAALREALRVERGIDAAGFDSLLARPVYLAEDAVRNRWIDGVAYREDRVAAYRGPDGARTVGAAAYARSETKRRGGAEIAIVHGQGMIAGGENRALPFYEDIMGSESMVREIRRAAENENARAIVLRLDTPGGDTWASDAIGHAIEAAMVSKPVVISMSDVCASGGYAIAYRASSIVALPSTVTGSIGSFTGKPNFAGLYEKFGVTHDGVTFGDHARFASSLTNWTEAEAAAVHDSHWRTYNDWIGRIAKARGMTAAEVDSMARGRVWTGREALERKLVDRLGGLDDAVAEAMRLAGIDNPDSVTLRHYPESQGFFDAVRSGEITRYLEAGAGAAAGRWMNESLQALSATSWSLMEIPVP